ncbi:MAG: hypothetical protein ACRCZK_07005 [Oscillospiraceae bacterium]
MTKTTLEIIEDIVLDALSDENVSVIKTKYILNENEEKEQIGAPQRRNYVKEDVLDIEDLKRDLKEPYLTSVLSLWGINK